MLRKIRERGGGANSCVVKNVCDVCCKRNGNKLCTVSLFVSKA